MNFMMTISDILVRKQELIEKRASLINLLSENKVDNPQLVFNKILECSAVLKFIDELIGD